MPSIEDSSNNDSGVIKSSIGVATELIKEVPIYQDAVQPVAKQTGRALETVGRTINAALSPVSLLVHGIEEVQNYLTQSLSHKFKDTLKDKIKTPNPTIAVPAMQALRYNLHDVELSDLFSNLLASSMHIDKKDAVHPSFVHVISNLTSDEAKILKCFIDTDRYPIIDIFETSPDEQGRLDILRNHSHLGNDANCLSSNNLQTYTDNLIRLNLLEIPSGLRIFDGQKYNELLRDEVYERIVKTVEDENFKMEKNKEKIKKLVKTMEGIQGDLSEEQKNELVDAKEKLIISQDIENTVNSHYPRIVRTEMKLIRITHFGKSFLESCIKPI